MRTGWVWAVLVPNSFQLLISSSAGTVLRLSDRVFVAAESVSEMRTTAWIARMFGAGIDTEDDASEQADSDS